MIFIAALIVILALNCQLGSSIRTEITREYNRDGLQTKLGIKCLVENFEFRRKNNIVLELVKDDTRTIMKLFYNGEVVKGPHYAPEVSMNGYLDRRDESKSYINVTYAPVSERQAGKYSCALRWHDYDGKFHTEYDHKRINVKVSTVKFGAAKEVDVDGKLNITDVWCLVDKEVRSFKSEVSLWLFKDDRKVVTVEEGGITVMGNLRKPGIHVVGNVDKENPGKSYLHVAYKPVAQESSGMYTCVYNSVDESGRGHGEYDGQRI